MELSVPTEVVLASFIDQPLTVYFDSETNNIYFEYVYQSINISSSTNILTINFVSSEEIPISLIEVLRGPPGLSEEDTMYSKRVDFITDNLLYRGEAVVGSSESASQWRLRKIVLGVDGDVTEIWASGSALFDKQWSERLTYTYT